MTPDQLAYWNAELRQKSPSEITRWAIAQADGRAVVSTNFRPYEAVLLHLCVQAQPEIPVLWVDHGYNRPATYKHAEELRSLLKLNLKVCLPRISAAHRDAVWGAIPALEDEAGLKQFSALMKLEPFQRGMKELAPKVWITALRQVQNANRAGLDIVSSDPNFGTLKVSPVFYQSDEDMEAYLEEHQLPNEWDYFDPAKASEKRECGLHAAWGHGGVEAWERGSVERGDAPDRRVARSTLDALRSTL
jgi:phosphoadenosine phosphosulfate reductase